MATYSIDSLPDGGLFTRLTIEARTGTLTAVQVYKTGQPPVLVDSLPLATNQFCVFNILFVRYDLKVQTNNSIPLGSVDYSLRQTATAQVSQTQAALSLAYNVPAKRYPRPAPAPPLPAFGGAIPVTVTFRRSDPGWIEVDLKFDYPPDIESDDADTAWELRVFPLRMLLNSESMNSYTALTADGGLTPFGDISQTGPVSIEMPVQFTSLFKFGRNNTTSINHIKGVAFAGTDENGHQKVTHYYRPDAATSAVEFQLTGPIHLKQGKFVRPVTSPGYVMSAGDDLGYGGARMTYRIRAFQIEGTAKNAPVDWHDAAKLYRKWVWTRTATIFRKHNAAHENRQTNAPV
ncbi:MAG TPA: hypothetical protein VJQ56_01665, partial [Blastocatellia bacterium]|nr:hypothetical protein [Blastocatellia bacterium]